MATAQSYLDKSRYQLINAIATTITIASGISIMLLLIGLLLVPDASRSLSIYLTMLVGSLLCGGLALWLLRFSLWSAITALAGLIISQELAAAFLFPELLTTAVPFLAVVVLLCSVSGRQMFTLVSGIICLLLSIGLIVFAPHSPSQTSVSLGAALIPIQAVVTSALIVVIWLVADRMIASQNTALDIAEHRRQESEKARTTAEQMQVQLEEQLNEQRRLLELIDTLELPVLSLNNGVLVTPLVGNLDSRRIIAIQHSLLQEVSRQNAHTVILDVTGIPTIDTAVAYRLQQTAQAVRLLGANPILSGIRAPVAQALVGLGVNLDTIAVVRDLWQALELSQKTPVA